MSKFESIIRHIAHQKKMVHFGLKGEVSLEVIQKEGVTVAYQLYIDGNDSVLVSPTPMLDDGLFHFEVVDHVFDRSNACFSGSRIAGWEELVYDILDGHEGIHTASKSTVWALSSAVDDALGYIFSLYQEKSLLISSGDKENCDVYTVVAKTVFPGTFTGEIKIAVKHDALASRVVVTSVDRHFSKEGKTIGVYMFTDKSSVQDIAESGFFIFPEKTLSESQYQKLCSELHELIALKLKANV